VSESYRISAMMPNGTADAPKTIRPYNAVFIEETVTPSHRNSCFPGLRSYNGAREYPTSAKTSFQVPDHTPRSGQSISDQNILSQIYRVEGCSCRDLKPANVMITPEGVVKPQLSVL
jgi:hypothetical protein